MRRAVVRAAVAGVRDHPDADAGRHAAEERPDHVVRERSVPEAERLAAILRPYDTYAIVIARQNVVTVYTAVSQSKRAMGAAQFQRSKSDLMDFVSELLGVEPEALGAAA